MSSQEAPEPLCADRLDLICNAPWWLISAGIHVAILLMATLVCIEKYSTMEEGEIRIDVSRSAPPLIDKLEEYLIGNVDRPPRPEAEPDAPDADPTQVVLFLPEAPIGTRNLGDDDDPAHEGIKGVSLDIDTHVRGGGERCGRGRADHAGPGGDSIGVGNGGDVGGLYGDRFGSDRNERIGAKGGGEQTIRSSELALVWLARHQSPDGNWKAAGFTEQCHGGTCDGAGYADYDTGVTGLALLAFLGAGYTHLTPKGETTDLRTPGKRILFKDVVKKGIRWLISNQDADGCVGPKVGKMMYNQAIVALALAEAYGMTESQILKQPAQKAIDYLTQAKNPYGAWRYTSRCGENDTSVTGWCVMALKSAKASNLLVSDGALHEANAWIKTVTDTNYGKVGYQDLGSAGVKVVVPGKNERYENHEALGAVGMMTRIFVDVDRKDPVLAETAKCLVGDLPRWDKAKLTNDYYYWYYATLALYQYDGPDSGGTGKFWKPWNEAIKRVLTMNQHTNSDGCAEGSWDADDRWGFEGGRVYAVAINALTMEVYGRYANAFGVATQSGNRE